MSDTELKKTLSKIDDRLTNIEKTLRQIIKNPLVKNEAKPGTKNKQSKKGPKHQLDVLVSDNFFKSPKSIPDILKELEKRSCHYKQGDLTRPLQTLCHEKILRRQKKKTTNKELWNYSNW